MTTDGFITIDGREATFIVNYDTKHCDDSFIHEFGVRHCGHEEITNLDIVSLIYCDDDNCKEVDDTPEIIESITEQITARLN